MKKVISIVILISITAMLFGCASATSNSSVSETTTEVTTTTTTAETVATFENGLSENDFEVQEYILVPWFSETDTHYLAIVKNNSKESIRLFQFEVTVFDANDNVIGTKTASGGYLAPGEETFCFCIFENTSNVDHATRKLNTCETGEFNPIYGTLEAKVQKNESEGYPELSIKNNGKYKAVNVSVFMVFFDKDGRLVNYTIADRLDALPSGDTKNVPFLSMISYDSVKVYYSKI